MINAVGRYIQNPLYAEKLYHQFEMQIDAAGTRKFQKANSGLVFQSFQLLDPTSSPTLVIIASDAAHEGNNRRHPLYCKFTSLHLNSCILQIVIFLFCSCASQSVWIWKIKALSMDSICMDAKLRKQIGKSSWKRLRWPRSPPNKIGTPGPGSRFCRLGCQNRISIPMVLGEFCAASV